MNQTSVQGIRRNDNSFTCLMLQGDVEIAANVDIAALIVL
jgi:hypothetical protein